MSTPAPPELVRAARGGDTAALERLLECVWPHAYRIAFSIIRDPHLAEDAAQEACAILYRTIRSLQSAQAFRVWFYRIVSREAVRLARSAPASRIDVEHAALAGDPAARMDLRDALAALTPQARAAIVLSYYHGFNSAEIGAILGIPAPTVRFRIAMAKRRLRALLGDSSPAANPMEVCR